MPGPDEVRLTDVPYARPTHKPHKGTKLKQHQTRPSAHQRGYDHHWARFRLWYLRRHPICADCQRAPAWEVHHVKPLADFPELKFDEDNLRGLCKPCHNRRTARERNKTNAG